MSGTWTTAAAAHTGSRGTKVFHSFRHSFIDALRLAGVPGEINIALVGHTGPSMNDKYGAKDKAIRFRHRLAEAVASVTYPGLDLSHLKKKRATRGHQRPCVDHPDQRLHQGLMDYRRTQPESRDTMAFFGAHDTRCSLF